MTGIDLGGLTLTPGVYFSSSSAQLKGTLTLDPLNNPHAQFVFQIGTTLTTASGSVVDVIDGLSDPPSCGRSAKLGAATWFVGNLLADRSITMNTTSKILCDRAIALKLSVARRPSRFAPAQNAPNAAGPF